MSQTTIRSTELVDIHQAAAYLTVSATTITRLMDAGHLPKIRIGRQIRTTISALDSYIKANTANL